MEIVNGIIEKALLMFKLKMYFNTIKSNIDALKLMPNNRTYLSLCC